MTFESFIQRFVFLQFFINLVLDIKERNKNSFSEEFPKKNKIQLQGCQVLF